MEAAENVDEALEEELANLTAAEAAKRNRERRKRNAQRAKDQLKLRLNMTTPMDIGIDAHAPGEDMFNLGLVDGKKVSASQDLYGDSEDDAEYMIEEEVEEDESDEDLDDEDRRIRKLETNLDEMYDAYQNAKLERDSKHRAREARRKKRAEEGGEWEGIGKGSDESDVDSEADSEVQPLEHAGSESDSDSDSDADSAHALTTKTKGNKRLLTDLKDPEKQKKRKIDEKERAAAVWYDQPVFHGVPGLDALLQGGEDDDEEENSDDEMPTSHQTKPKSLFQQEKVMEWSSDEEEEGYEVVPATDLQAEEDKANERAQREWIILQNDKIRAQR